MAKKNDEETQVTQSAADAPAGVEGKQSKRTADKSSSEVKSSLARAEDRELHPGGEPKRQADSTSYPVPNDAEIHDPPLRSAKPDVGVVGSLATGAGKHEPPDPDEFHEDGRPRL